MIKATSAIHALTLTGVDRYVADFKSEISDTLAPGFSLEEGIKLIFAAINESDKEPIKHVYAG